MKKRIQQVQQFVGAAFILFILTPPFVGCGSRGSATKDGEAELAKSYRLIARPLTAPTFERTPQRLARGRYLYESVLICDYCHAPFDEKIPGGPPLPGKSGSGLQFSISENPAVVAPNITSDPETGAGRWTDDMLARAIREGIGHDGRALDADMPYALYRVMSDEDLASLVVYLRSLPPVRNSLPAMTTPAQYKQYLQPAPITAPVAPPDLSIPFKRGEYLVRLAHCTECHTPGTIYQPMTELELGGGNQVNGPWGTVSCANLTPAPSGINYYDEAQFLKAIRTGKVGARKLNDVMPWWFFGQMKDEDLKAIFAYLRTLKPISHRVDNSEPVAFCRVCKQKHAGGALN
jgi:mono/diheme cytochrome c family protein